VRKFRNAKFTEATAVMHKFALPAVEKLDRGLEVFPPEKLQPSRIIAELFSNPL
jgi:hypothetical protein